MKIKPIIIFSIVLCIALFVAVLSYNHLQKKFRNQPVTTHENQPIAVAAFDLSWGTLLTKNMIRMVPFLKESLPPGHFTDISSIEGRTLLYPLKANEPIFESRLAPNTLGAGGVAAVLTPQKRAMSVKVDKMSGIAGFIHPGNRVDVLVTLKKREKNCTPITKIVLENILVLATGQEMEKTDKKEKPTQVDVITLEVTPEEGEKLALAATEGTIQLALRNFSDIEDVITKGATVPALLASYRSGKKGTQTQKINPAIPSMVSVQLIKGSSITELSFEKGGE
jgi:pilus assembly protein CpaB